jgi:hypothetical protein
MALFCLDRPGVYAGERRRAKRNLLSARFTGLGCRALAACGLIAEQRWLKPRTRSLVNEADRQIGYCRASPGVNAGPDVRKGHEWPSGRPLAIDYLTLS